jgi:hypothetical protein
MSNWVNHGRWYISANINLCLVALAWCYALYYHYTSTHFFFVLESTMQPVNDLVSTRPWWSFYLSFRSQLIAPNDKWCAWAPEFFMANMVYLVIIIISLQNCNHKATYRCVSRWKLRLTIHVDNKYVVFMPLH